MFLDAAQKGRIIILLSVLIVLAGLAFDLSMPLGVAGGVPYIALVLVAQWSPWKSYIYYMAVLGTVLTIAGYLASPYGGIPWVVMTNRALAIFAIWVTALLCARVQKDETREMQLRRLWHAVEQSPISIIITDAVGSIEYVNPCFKQLTGYQEEEVLGRNPSILKSGNTHGDAYSQLWDSIVSGQIWRGILQNRKKNGELYWVSSTIVPVTNQQDDIDHYIAFNEDITYLREKEDMLTHAMKLEAVGRMTNGIAHDFRNLLTVILGNLQLLQDGIIQHDSELITDALSAAHDGSELIKRLLAFSRRKEQSTQTIDVNASIQDLLRLLQRTVHDNVNISLVTTEATITVTVDLNRLESAILNLVINAQDAMPKGGKLTITTGTVNIEDKKLTDPKDIHPGKYVTISIADNGIGMDGDTRRHALEPFYSTKASGTGLGLSMVNDFITAAGGAIGIESSPGEGTTITLWLPAARTTGKYNHKTDVIDSLPTGTETVLLVEDSDRVRVFAHRILTHLGYRVVEAANATEALEYIQHDEDFDLLFTDIVMPGELDGVALAEQACIRLPSLRVLLTTGMDFHADERRKPGMDYPLLTKPYSAKQLAQSIRNILDTGQLTD